MKRINKPSYLPKEFLQDVIDRKKRENKERLQGLQEQLERLYDAYTDKADKSSLHGLHTQWAYNKKDTKSDGYFLYHQYDNSKKAMAELQAKIIEANGGNVVLKCPLCGLRDTSDMDHYVPRQLFPEYSIHAYNLIPTCHQCNTEKSNHWCKDGKRLIFNAYYDSPTDEHLFDVSIQEENGVLRIVLELRPFVHPQEATRLALSTINTLKLMPFINNKVNEMFSKQIGEILRWQKHSKGPIEDFLAMEHGALADTISAISDVNDFNRIVCTAVKDNPTVKSWLINHFAISKQ